MPNKINFKELREQQGVKQYELSELTGLTPATIEIPATAPPKGKLPSAVKSGKSSVRNEIRTPSATRP